MPITDERLLAALIFEKLRLVYDPEIPTVSLVDLGMIERVRVEKGKATIDVLPTFSGCPALAIMEQKIIKEVSTHPQIKSVTVRFVTDVIWTTERITDEAKEKLKAFGIAPPPKEMKNGGWNVECPYCQSPLTVMENLFGPTACRSIMYCKSCKNPFEVMKPIGV